MRQYSASHVNGSQSNGGIARAASTTTLIFHGDDEVRPAQNSAGDLQACLEIRESSFDHVAKTWDGAGPARPDRSGSLAI
jgi:hypothetical protein